MHSDRAATEKQLQVTVRRGYGAESPRFLRRHRQQRYRRHSRQHPPAPRQPGPGLFDDPFAQQVGVQPVLKCRPGERYLGQQASAHELAFRRFVIDAATVTLTPANQIGTQIERGLRHRCPPPFRWTPSSSLTPWSARRPPDDAYPSTAVSHGHTNGRVIDHRRTVGSPPQFGYDFL